MDRISPIRKNAKLVGLAILILILIVIMALRHHKASPTTSFGSQKVISLTIKGDRIVKGPSNIQAAAGQRLKITTQGLGYGEGDNLIIQGYSQSFFELDELDGPMTQYVTISKRGVYPLIIQNSDKRIGQIVIR